MTRARGKPSTLPHRLLRVLLRRLLLALLGAALCFLLVVWTLGWLSRLEPGRVPEGELLSSASLLTFGTPSLIEFLRSSELLPLGASYPLVLVALVLRPPRRRRLLWWLGSWAVGALSVLMAALALLFASLEFRQMVQSGSFPLSALLGMGWTLTQEALLLSLRSGTLLLGFPLARLLLEGVLRRLEPRPAARAAPPEPEAPPAAVVQVRDTVPSEVERQR